jgi:hypothetical protein
MGSFALNATWAAGVGSATRDRSLGPGPSQAPPRCSRPSALRLSQPLGGLILPRLCGLVSCALPRAGFLPPGVFPSRQPHQTHRLAVPSCRYRLTCQKLRGPKPARLPSMRPTDFRALLRLKVRTRRADVTLSFGPIPSWDLCFLSRAFPLPAVPSASPEGAASGSAHALGLGGSLACGRLRTRRSFTGAGSRSLWT